MSRQNEQRGNQTRLVPPTAGAALVLLLLLSSCTLSKDKTMKLPDSDLVFTGTIVVVHSSTVDGLDPENSVIVNVTDVHRLPDGFDPLEGQALSLQMKDVSSAHVGEQRTFFADVVTIGAELGLMEVSSEPAGADKQSRDSLTRKVKENDMKRADDDLRQRVEKASAVALGKIVSITPMKKEQVLIREHNPEWQIVELQLSGVAKGGGEKTIRFLYPGSRDILFVRYPQLQMDQEWVVILDKSDEKEVELVISHPSNILPASEFKHVESVIKK